MFPEENFSMRDISLKQLETFAAVVKYGSFTEAAARLYMAQSTVSSHIQLLESELDTTLFFRESKRHIRLTPEGERVYQYAKDILAKRDELLGDIFADSDNELTIGASTFPSRGIVAGLVSAFYKNSPPFTCDIRDGDSGEIQQMLLDGVIQVGFVGASDNRHALIYEKIREDHLILIAPDTPYYASFKEQGLSGRDLLSEPMIFREPGSGTQKMIDNYLSAMDVSTRKVHVIARVSSPEVLKELVAEGVGVSIVSELTAKEYVDAGKILSFELAKEPLTRNIYMAYRKKGPRNKLANNFIAFVQQLK